MGFSGSYKSGEGDALFEVTVSFNPGVAIRYFLSVDGFWRQLWTLVLTLCWLVFGATFQLSLSAYFPEFPLYPLPVIVGYLSWSRSSFWGLFWSLCGGVVLDSLEFSGLGHSSWILFLCHLWGCYLRERLGCGDWHLGYWGMVLGGVSVMIYVLGKLLLLGCASGGNAVVSALPWNLLMGGLLNGIVLSPILYWLLDGVEWLFRVKRHQGSVIHGQ